MTFWFAIPSVFVLSNYLGNNELEPTEPTMLIRHHYTEIEARLTWAAMRVLFLLPLWSDSVGVFLNLHAGIFLSYSSSSSQ